MADRHFRAKARPEVRVRVRWRRLDEPHTREVEAQTRNISVGGAFILTELPPPAGTRIEVAIASPATWEPVRVHALVRWTTSASADEGAGMGVEFDDLQARDVVSLHDFFLSLQFSG